MKFVSLAAAALASALPAFACTSTGSLTYDNIYDDPSFSLLSVACSNGANGLLSEGYTTLGSLPSFPYVGGVDAVTGWNSPACGTCWNVTYGDTTLSVLAVDVAPEGFNLSEEAMNRITGGLAAELGRVEVTAEEVSPTWCGIY